METVRADESSSLARPFTAVDGFSRRRLLPDCGQRSRSIIAALNVMPLRFREFLPRRSNGRKPASSAVPYGIARIRISQANNRGTTHVRCRMGGSRDDALFLKLQRDIVAAKAQTELVRTGVRRCFYRDPARATGSALSLLSNTTCESSNTSWNMSRNAPTLSQLASGIENPCLRLRSNSAGSTREVNRFSSIFLSCDVAFKRDGPFQTRTRLRGSRVTEPLLRAS